MIPASPIAPPDGISAHCGALGLMTSPHCHDELEFSIIISGSQQTVIGGKPIRQRAGMISLFWAAAPHRPIKIERPGRFALAHLPVPWFINCWPGSTLVERVLGGETLVEQSPDLRFDSRLFLRWVEDFQSQDLERRDIARQEIRARLRRMALNLSAATHSPPSPADRFEADATMVMTRFIAENFRDPLRVADIAAAADMPPDAAARLFSKVWHMPPTAFVTRYRLTESQRLLATTNYKIVDIAQRAGFGSVSHFYAAFQTAFGCSPRESRQRMTRGDGER
jgi:AraC-like DNA-binding protein